MATRKRARVRAFGSALYGEAKGGGDRARTVSGRVDHDVLYHDRKDGVLSGGGLVHLRRGDLAPLVPFREQLVHLLRCRDQFDISAL